MINIDFDTARLDIIRSNRIEAEHLYCELKAKCGQEGTLDVAYKMLNQYQKRHLATAAEKLCMSADDLLFMLIEKDVPELAILVLAKESGRTGYQEKLQYDALSTQSTTCSQWNDPPKSGANAYGLNHGNIVSMSDSMTKSVDFSTVSKKYGKKVLVAAKYTNEDGGAQDNQARDLEEFARQAPDRHSSIVVVLVADGAYYKKQRRGYNGMNFFDYIRSTYSDKNVIATTTSDFDENLGDFLAEAYGR